MRDVVPRSRLVALVLAAYLAGYFVGDVIRPIHRLMAVVKGVSSR